MGKANLNLISPESKKTQKNLYFILNWIYNEKFFQMFFVFFSLAQISIVFGLKSGDGLQWITISGPEATLKDAQVGITASLVYRIFQKN